MNIFVVWLVAVVLVSVLVANLLGWMLGWPQEQVNTVTAASIMATLLVFAGRTDGRR